MIQNIIDSHSHYNDSAFDNDRDIIIPEILSKIKGIIHASTDVSSSQFGIEMANKYQGFFTSIGFHPESMDKLPENPTETLRELFKTSGKIIAIGEIGLDYHYDGYDRKAQIKLFESQIVLAKGLGLPVIVHMRDATEDCMEILKKHKPRGVMHCFGGSAETAQEVLKLGMYISFTGVITFKNAKKAIRALEVVPTDRILLETDCPYMAPEPYRGKRCDSLMIEKTATKMAEIKGLTPCEMIENAKENTCKLFNIEI
ncbi:MAG: TatD family hydrolase [Clostridiales bacterium]|nr:TatD family hydrolase [Clostridiales bacterium]